MKRTVRPLFACALSLISTSALATHFISVIDPITGHPTIVVSSGIVGTTPTQNSQPNVLPSQNVAIQLPQQSGASGVQAINASDFVNAASPEIIQALIKNKSNIDQENQTVFLNASPQTPPSPPVPGNAKSPQGQSDLDQIANNLDNLIGGIALQMSQSKTGNPSSTSDSGSQPDSDAQIKNNVLLSAAQAAEQRRTIANRLSGSNGATQPDNLRPDAPADNGVVTGVLMQQIANNVQEQTRPLQQALNKSLNTPTSPGAPGAPAQAPNPELDAARQNAMDALNDLTQAATNVAIQAALQTPKRDMPTIVMDRTAGVDPEAERRRQEQKQQAEERKQQQIQQKEERKQQVEDENKNLIAQIQEAARQQQQQNQQAQEEKRQEAIDRLQQMTAKERERLQQDRAKEKERQSPASPTASKNPPPSAPSGISVAESLRQSMGQLQDQNNIPIRQPAHNEAPSGNNTPSINGAVQSVLLNLGRTVPDLDRTAGVDPELERRRQEQIQLKEAKRQEVQDQNQQVLAQIQNAMAQLQQQNQQAQQEKQSEATERYLQQLTAEERERFLQSRIQEQKRQSQDSQTENRNQSPSAPGSISVAETLRQSIGQLQDQNSQQTKQPAGKEAAPESNMPSDAQALQDAIARLQVMLSQLDQLMSNQRGPDGSKDENGQSLAQKLAQLTDVYAGLIPQTGTQSTPPQNSSPNLPQLASLTQELAARTQEQSQESLKQLDEALKLATGKALDPWGSYIYVARQEHTTRVPEYGLNGTHTAYYSGQVRGTVGEDTVNGMLELLIGFGSNTTIEGGMWFGDDDANYLLIDSGGRTGSGFKGHLSGQAFGGDASGSLQGALYGSQAQQVGGTWNVSVRDSETNALLKSGGGVFAGAQSAPEN